MAITIKKVKLINFKRFEDFVFEPNETINVLIGDNEVGKSSILEAIDLVSSGSVRKVENIGLDRLINIKAIEEFEKDKSLENLPEMIIELYLKGEFDHTMNGKNNSLCINADGIRLVCSPNEDFVTEIKEILVSEDSDFPYEYYRIRFSTFSDEGYSGYKRKLKTVLINSMNISSEYATRDFIERMYNQYTENDIKERVEHRSKYRQMKLQFCKDHLVKLNKAVPSEKGYLFGLQNNYSDIFSQDLMIYEDSIAINNKGTGKQVLIKTDFALERAGENVDIVLIEEPENHLSHGNLKKLISSIASKQKGQIFITTHNSLISTRLNLNNAVILSDGNNEKSMHLHNLDKETSEYFLKAPPADILEFVLSAKIILVEGPSEYILFDNLYQNATGSSLDQDKIHVLAIRGLSFKRYLEIAKITKSRVAVITDNDGDYQKNCIKKYEEYGKEGNIKIFYEEDNEKRTFEYCLYGENKATCDKEFGNDPLGYMLNNKTKIALEMSKIDEIRVPSYIKRAIEWIRE